jgi:hypothetical protein
MLSTTATPLIFPDVECSASPTQQQEAVAVMIANLKSGNHTCPLTSTVLRKRKIDLDVLAVKGLLRRRRSCNKSIQ